MASKTLKSLVDNHWLFSELLKHKAAFGRAVFLTFLINIFQIVTSLFVMVVYNKVLPNNAVASLYTLVIGISIVVAFDAIFKLLKSRIVSVATDGVEEKLQHQLFQKILSWDLQSRPKLSGAASTLVRDIESISELFANSSITTVVGIPFIFINSFVIYLFAGPLALVTLGIALIALVVSVYFYFRVKNISAAAKQSSIDKNSIYLEALGNLETLKSIGTYSYFTSRYEEADTAQRDFACKLKDILSDANTFNTTLSSIAQIALVAVGALLVIKAVIDPGALFAAVILNGKTLQPVMQLAGLLQRYSVAKVSYSKLSKTFEFISEEEKRRENISLKLLKGPIIAQGIKFQPPAIPNPILEINKCTIKEGEKIGVVGSVGSGKTTFLKLLAGILTPTAGNISYGSYDTTAINQTDLRRDVSYLGQNPGVFAGSFRDNICLGNPKISDESVDECISLTGFDQVLKKFPNGLSYQLSENGSELSGGQKQILALTRAILAEPRFVFFDEPTSAMDPRHENLFIRQMQKFLSNRTFVVVTHRKPILNLVDRLMVIENGRIIMDGKRDEVLKKFS